MRNRLIFSLTTRLAEEIAPQSPVKFLRSISVEEMIDVASSVLYLYTRGGRHNQKSAFMTEVISAIGHTIRNKHKLRRDSGAAAKAGAFILYSFELALILKVKLGKGPRGHAAYVIAITDDDSIIALWNTVKPGRTEKLPALIPYANWTTTHHPSGAKLIKTNNTSVLEITEETHPIVFEVINRSQQVGWKINTAVYNLYTWAIRNKVDAFAEIWEMHSPEAKASKLRETTTIGETAAKFLDKTFYHLYYYDFRGRKYPATAYLHEQGPDLAKGLLLRADEKSIGVAGFNWLLISIATNWGGDAGRGDGFKTDKISLHDRALWTQDNEEIIISYAENPKLNQGWMKADKPWQFIAACMELHRFRKWQKTSQLLRNVDPYDYKSSLECYIDGSNNGSQHLSALTRDEVTAPHVNLVPSELPGDLYKYVAEHVWKKINTEVKNLSPEAFKNCEELIDNLTDLKIDIQQAPQKSDIRAELVTLINDLRHENDDLLSVAAKVFWYRIKDQKERRKVVKRNVMTLPYGGTAYGLGQQQIDDARKHGIEMLNTMEHRWGSYMGRAVFEDCRESLKRPMQLLSVFEEAGKKAEERKEFLKWNVPITNFPVVQHYTEGRSKKLYVQYGPPGGVKNSSGYYENTLQLSVCHIEDVIPSKYKQAQGASPNAIHSLDAAHLMLTVHNCDFTVTTIHDSYGCLLADMDKLFVNVRKSFLQLYNSDPLKSLMEQIGGDISNVEIGTLDLNLVLDSQYCFA